MKMEKVMAMEMVVHLDRFYQMFSKMPNLMEQEAGSDYMTYQVARWRSLRTYSTGSMGGKRSLGIGLLKYPCSSDNVPSIRVSVLR